MKLQGSYPALITPFYHDMLDEQAFRALCRRLIRAGSAGLVPCGSTGEAATLSPMEYRRVIAIAVEEAGGKIPVIAGVGTNATDKACSMAKTAVHLGVDGLLVVAPYYNKPTQEGLYLHFQAIAKSVRVPIIVYNIPGRTAVNIQPSTLARLARACSNIVGVKEASGSLDQASETINACPPGFTILSGDDSLTLPMMAIGAKGVVSVAANIVPREIARLCSSFIKGDVRTAQRLHAKLFPLMRALFVETNPIPVKAAAGMMGLCRNELRLPLTSLSSEHRKKLAGKLRAYGRL